MGDVPVDTTGQATLADLGLSNGHPLAGGVMRHDARFVLLATAAIVGCSTATGERAGGARLTTLFDSTGSDSVIATTAGFVDAASVRPVVEELRIAGTREDTSLFADAFEFDVGQDGRMYVFDQPARSILIFDSAGALVRRVGRSGSGPGEFLANNGMTVLADGRLAQWDSRNARVNFLSADGDYLESWSVPGGFSPNNALRTDRTGALYVMRPVTRPAAGAVIGRLGLIRLVGSGQLADSLEPPNLPFERIAYVASRGKNFAQGFSEWTPTHSARFLWAWHEDGYFVSVSTGTYAIESSRPERPLRIVRDAPTIPVPDDERTNNQERITASLQRVDPAWTWPGPPIPTTKPPVAGLFVGRDGSIWVRVAVPSVEIPELEREQARPDQPPPLRFRDAALEYEVFTGDGRFLHRIRLPWRAQVMEADGERVWYLDRDADGLPAVVRARIPPDDSDQRY